MVTQTPQPNGASNTDSATENVPSGGATQQQFSRADLEHMRKAIDAEISKLDQPTVEPAPEAPALAAGEPSQPEPTEETPRGRSR